VLQPLHDSILLSTRAFFKKPVDLDVRSTPTLASIAPTNDGFGEKETMAYTVKRVAAMSGVSGRTLRFYDQTGLLKPAYTKANGYRIYEEQQLLVLQQILFYRELGFELKQIKKILSQRKFEKVAALKSHRQVLEKNVSRTRTLIETIDKTIKHLKGTKKMKSEELFTGFSVGAGKDRSRKGSLMKAQRSIARCRGRTPAERCVFWRSTTPDGRAT
jgi:DNA-binding transcriptional MerR regulator